MQTMPPPVERRPIEVVDGCEYWLLVSWSATIEQDDLPSRGLAHVQRVDLLPARYRVQSQVLSLAS